MDKVVLVRVPTQKRTESETGNNLFRFCFTVFFAIASIGFALWLSASIPNLLVASVHVSAIGLFAGLAGMLLYRVSVGRDAVYSLVLAMACIVLTIVFWESFIYVLRTIGPTYLMVGITLSPILTMCPLGLGIYEERSRVLDSPHMLTDAEIRAALGPKFVPKTFGAVITTEKT